MLRRALIVAALAIAPAAHATNDRVRLAEVHASEQRHEGVLRSAALDELARLDLSRVPASKESMLSVALVRLDVATSGDARVVSCVVSATLRRKKGGALYAILEGRVRVEGRGAAPEATAIAAAVRAAVARVPDALK